MAKAKNDLNIVNLPVSALKPYAGNPRKHTKKQIRQIAASIKEFGWTNPILVDEDNTVLAGHGRIEAAVLLGWDSVPVVSITGLSKARRRAYVLADNRLAEKAGWDRDLLKLELQGLIALDPEFDLELTGFEMGEVDMLITGDGGDGEEDEADWLPEAGPDRPVVTQPDDLWRLGPHRLYCGNALHAAAYDALLGGEKAEMVFTDPPYNVKIDGHVSGLGSVRHDEFAMAAGEMTYQEFVAFLNKALGLGAGYSHDGSIHFVCMDWRHLRELLEAGTSIFAALKNICVWAKPNAGMGSLYRSQHELIGVFKKGIASHINNVALGSHGRHRSNVWRYAGMNSFGAGRAQALAAHPTVKPVALVRDAILDCSSRGGIVLDAFAGSGTTIIAAERTGRRGFGMELEPRYVDVALRRFQRLTGTEAVHVASGMTFGQREQASMGFAEGNGSPPAPQGARHRSRTRSGRD